MQKITKNRKKNLISILIVSMLILTGMISTMGVKIKADTLKCKIYVYIQNKLVASNEMKSNYPIIKNKSIMLPAKFVASKMGLNYSYDEKNKMILMGKGKDQLKIILNKDYYVINERKLNYFARYNMVDITSDNNNVPAPKSEIINNVLYVPLECFGNFGYRYTNYYDNNKNISFLVISTKYYKFLTNANNFYDVISGRNIIKNLEDANYKPNKTLYKGELYPCWRWDGKMGYRDNTGKLIIPFWYEHAYKFRGDYAFVSRQSDGYGYIDKSGKFVIQPTGNVGPELYKYTPDLLEDTFSFSEGLVAMASIDKKVKSPGVTTKIGFINAAAKYVVLSDYNDAHRFSEGLAFVAKTNTVLINKDQFDYYSKKMGITAVGQYKGKYCYYDTKYGYVDKTGKLAIPLKFTKDLSDWIYSLNFSEGMAVGITKVGFIDHKGNYVIKPQYTYALGTGEIQDAYRFSEGLAAVAVSDSNGSTRWGYVNTKGEFVIPPVYMAAESFSEGVAQVVNSDSTHSYIDKNGNQACNGLRVYAAAAFHEGVALVRTELSNGQLKYGYIDKTGNYVIEPAYAYAEDFYKGVALVKYGNSDKNEKGDRWVRINKQGKILWEEGK
jgi:hypothetical protein